MRPVLIDISHHHQWLYSPYKYLGHLTLEVL
jgi:hypothetical protein